MMDDGTCRIYRVEDDASPGEMPAPHLVPHSCDYDMPYEDRMISYSRAYAAMGADQQIDKIIRIWRIPVEIGNVAVVDGNQYQIDIVQPTLNEDQLKVTDLTLRRLEENYDIAQ